MARVALSSRAAELLVTLTGIHGSLVFHQSGRCRDGSAPMCFPDGESTLGGSDVHLADLTAEGVEKQSASTCPPRSSNTGSTRT